MTSGPIIPLHQIVDARRCLVLVDAILDLNAVREKLAHAGMNHSAYLVDMARLDLIKSLYRVPDEEMGAFAKRLFTGMGAEPGERSELSDCQKEKA
jgi:hypothetical protein